jgi:Na+/melibiose symporter-like transporter
LPERAEDALGWGRALLFASGDFACNLYWQSATLYLLFYDTDLLEIAPHAAGLVYFAGLAWDGLAGLLIGLLADRSRGGGAGLGRWLRLGAVPLALSFLLVYWAPPARGLVLILFVFAAHLAFRTLYAAVNVPYVAWLARVARTSAERSRIAGLRMIFGAAAAVLVAIGTQHVAAGGGGGRSGFFLAALLFAGIATLVLLWVSAARLPPLPPGDTGPTPRRVLVQPLNAAFVTLNLAAIAGVVATTMVGKSVLYYFKYQLHDEPAAGGGLALMGVVGVLFVPVWMAVAERWGARAQWFASVATAMAALGGFLAAAPATAVGMDAFLILFQAAVTGFAFGFWAMLPDAIEHRSSAPADAQVLMFGLASLLQKIGVGAAAALVGSLLAWSGYRANVEQSAGTLLSLKAAMTVVPLVALLLSAAAMAFNPLRPQRRP